MKDSVSKNYKWFFVGLWALLLLAIFMSFVEIFPWTQSMLYIVLFFISTFPITTLLSKYLMPKAFNGGSIHTFIIQFVLLTLLLTFFHVCIVKFMLFLEQQGVFPVSNYFLNRSFLGEFLGNIISAMATNLFFCAISFFEVHFRMLKEHARLKQARLEDQLQLLREQINPHLMFNVLNHIHILMKKNVDVADELLLRYSDVLRYQLYECDRETVLLEKEIDYLKDVVEVEKTRWGNELKVDCTFNIENGKKEISPLLLIPFVENAFKHVSRMPHELGYVKIVLNQEGNTLRLIVKNSISNQAPPPRKRSGIGLENVKKRLDILYPGKHELLIQKTDSVYKTTLIITL